MRLTHRVIAPLALALAGVVAGAQPRQIALYFTVEQDGALVQGLTEENFRLYEDGQPRKFRLEQPETPASIALLVEYSQASWIYLDDIYRAMEGFMQEAPEGHWYALATFARDLEIRVDFTKMRGRVASAFADLPQPFWNEINTYDAVYEMLDRMGRLKGRKILIFIGSGIDTFSAMRLQDVQRKAEQVDVVVYAIGVGSLLRGYYEPYLTDISRMNLVQAEAFLQMLARKTGGEAWFPRFEAAFVDVMRGIMQSLQFQYKLVYESDLPDDGKFHRIRLEAFQIQDDRKKTFKVRVREGWRTG